MKPCVTRVECSVVTILKFFTTLSLNLCFISEVRWDNGACSGGLEPQFTCDLASAAATSLGWILAYLLLHSYPATTATLCPRGAFGMDIGKVRDRHMHAHGPSLSVIECKSVCPTHSQAKQYQNVGVWSRERFIAGPCKETGGSCLKNPQLRNSLAVQWLRLCACIAKCAGSIPGRGTKITTSHSAAKKKKKI